MSADAKSIIRDHWNRRAAGFDRSPQHAIAAGSEQEEWQRLFASFIGDRPLRVLDLGTGTGEIALLLAGMGHHVTGTDFAPDMIARAQAKAAARGLSATFIAGDAEAPLFADASFDVVVNRHLLWTLPHPAQALAEWRRVLIPGGKLVIVDGNWTEARSLFRRITTRFKALLTAQPLPSLDVYRDCGIADKLPLQQQGRPAADLAMLQALGFVAHAERIGPGGDFFRAATRDGKTYERFVLFARKPEA